MKFSADFSLKSTCIRIFTQVFSSDLKKQKKTLSTQSSDYGEYGNSKTDQCVNFAHIISGAYGICLENRYPLEG